jgi:hypothetical protein
MFNELVVNIMRPDICSSLNTVRTCRNMHTRAQNIAMGILAKLMNTLHVRCLCTCTKIAEYLNNCLSREMFNVRTLLQSYLLVVHIIFHMVKVQT